MDVGTKESAGSASADSADMRPEHAGSWTRRDHALSKAKLANSRSVASGYLVFAGDSQHLVVETTMEVP